MGGMKTISTTEANELLQKIEAHYREDIPYGYARLSGCYHSLLAGMMCGNMDIESVKNFLAHLDKKSASK